MAGAIGQVYTTKPGGAFFFPQLATPTGELKLAQGDQSSSSARGLMMPRRKHTRAQDRAYRIASERHINEQHLAEEHRRRQEWLAATYEPPPF